MARSDRIIRAITFYQMDNQLLSILPFTSGIIDKNNAEIKRLEKELKKYYADQVREREWKYSHDMKALERWR